MINNQAHKRKLVPVWSDYSCYTTCKDGVWVLMNGNDKLLHTFKDKEDCLNKANAIVKSIFTLYRFYQIDYETHLRKHPEYYVKTYEEGNWAHKCLYKGFVPDDETYNPYHNWFGCSAYDPDKVLIKGNKRIVLSLQGICTRYTPGYTELWEGGKIKYLHFTDNGVTLYETWTGKLPDIDWIEKFIE